MITSYLVVFGALSRMVKVQGAGDKPFWIYKRLNNCAAPAPDSDDILVVASLACRHAPHIKTLPALPLKRHHWPARGRRNYSIAYIMYPKRLIVCTSDLHHSTQRPEHHEIKSYHFWVNFLKIISKPPNIIRTKILVGCCKKRRGKEDIVPVSCQLQHEMKGKAAYYVPPGFEFRIRTRDPVHCKHVLYGWAIGLGRKPVEKRTV